MLSAPGLGSALVKISYEPLDVGQLVVQVLAAQFLFVVVGAVLFDLFVLFHDFFLHLLMLFGARGQLPTLGVQLGKAAGDVLHASVQQAVLIILCIEIVLVALPLVEGHQCCVLQDIVRCIYFG